MVLKQLNKNYGCEKEQEQLINKKSIQIEYQFIVGNYIDESKAGELDDQAQLREDNTKIVSHPIFEAADQKIK